MGAQSELLAKMRAKKLISKERKRKADLVDVRKSSPSQLAIRTVRVCHIGGNW